MNCAAGLRGFYIFLACIALGVAAISGVNSVARSITEGIAEEGQEILGGDVAVSLVQQEVTPEQLAFLANAMVTYQPQFDLACHGTVAGRLRADPD